MSVKSGQKKKPIWKKWWFWALILAVLIGGIMELTEPETTETINDTAATESTVTTEPETKEDVATEEPKDQAHIYDSAIVKDVINGFRTEKIGEYSVIEIASDQITEDSLADWYFNYVSKNDFNWCMILYTDKNGNEGIYANNGYVSKDVVFEVDEYGDYALGDSSKGTTYYPNEEGRLQELYSANNNADISGDMDPESFIENIKTAIQGQVGEDEYIIDVELKNENLHIYVDFSEADPTPLTIEDLAMMRTASITDKILEFKEYDTLWNTITVDFGDIGSIENGKDNIDNNEYGRFFREENFELRQN